MSKAMLFPRAIYWLLVLAVALGSAFSRAGLALAAPNYSAWNDLGIIYTAPSGDAYYPSVLYDANGFDSASPLYKMWYSNGAGGVFVITSTTGSTWGTPITVTGLHAGAHHVQVAYDANCFGALPCDASAARYKLWYWVGTMTYTISDLATAQSTDGIHWTSDTTLTQSATAPLVTGAGVGWNRGAYGPINVFYRPGATNSGSNPWNYSFVMYYDGTDGQHEATGLAYSTDGLYWSAYPASPILDHGVPADWDGDDSAYGTIMQIDGMWHFWYSGGSCNYSSSCPVSEGVGYASSPDGFTWTKDASNPIFYFTDSGFPYRSKRVYTPAVVDDGSGILKMYYSAVGTDNVKKIGLALNAVDPRTVFVDDNWVGLTTPTQVMFPGDPNLHFIGVDAFAIIQDGVNAVTPSGTVNVAAGTYNESLSISKPLTLQSSSGAASTIINGGDPYSVLITSRDVTVDGFTITNPGYTGASDAAGIVVEPDPYGSNAQVRITNNIIHDIGSPGRTSVAYGNCGINIGFADGVEIDHNEIYNIIHSDPVAWANGVCIWGGGPGTPADHITIHDNSFYDISSPYPADAAISTQTDVGSVTVYNNSIVSTPGNPTEYGVEVRSTITDVVLRSNLITGYATVADIQSGNAIFAGNTIVTNTTVFSQSGGVLTVYANNITNFTTGLISSTGGTYNIRHNWWGTYSEPAPTGVDAVNWQARLGAPVNTWADGDNSATLVGTLGTANLDGVTGTAVIVSHGRNAANAPFGNVIAPYLCSDYYDFFTADASGTWTVTVPVDNTADCNSQVRDPGKVFWIPYPLPNPAHWAPVTTNIITRSQVIVVSNLAPTDLGGTPFAAGLTTGTPTAITLIDFSAASASNSYVLLIVLPIVLALLIVGLRLRRKARV